MKTIIFYLCMSLMTFAQTVTFHGVTINEQERNVNTLEDGFILTEINDFGEQITCITTSDDAQYMFTGLRNGKVVVSDWNGTNFIKRIEPIIDISEQVTTFFERGLLDIYYTTEYNPELEITEILLLIYYTVEENYLWSDVTADNTATINRVSSYSLDLVNNSSTFKKHIIGEEIDEGIPSLAGNHQGGSIARDSNGYLYISTGDSANMTYSSFGVDRGIISPDIGSIPGGRYLSQSLSSLNGKVLRVDINTGEGIPSNPFFTSNALKSPQSRIYSIGLRNAFRMSLNGSDAYVAEVGAASFEEINKISIPALNFGWGLREGFDTYSFSSNVIDPFDNELFITGLIEPTSDDDSSNINTRINTLKYPRIAYSHNEEPAQTVDFFNDEISPLDSSLTFSGSSITGGVIIQGDALSEELNGKYIFADFGRFWLNYTDFNDVYTLGNLDVNGIVDFYQNPVTGELYLARLFGQVYELSYDETLSINSYNKSNNNIIYYSKTKLLKISEPVDIYNINGKKVLHLKSSNTLNLSSGTYLVESKKERKKILII